MVLTASEVSVVPSEARMLFRKGEWTDHTGGLCLGLAQANLAIVPKDVAFDFLLFCQRNPKPCPLLEVLDPGDPTIRTMADNADVRTDLPQYRVYVKGELVDEPTDILEYWKDDLVGFLLGCSHSFEEALMNGGVPMRHIESGCMVSAYDCAIECASSVSFQGNMVVSGRSIPADKVAKAVQITSRYPGVHGSPVHIGDPSVIGVDFLQPTYGAPPQPEEGDVPVFWACGVTPQLVARNSKVDLLISHAPGAMFITDIPNEHLASL